MHTLPNGYIIFQINDRSNLLSLGLVLNKNYNLVSYGTYINDKLSGLGCKF